MLPLGIRAPVCADALAGACFCAGRSRRSRRIATWKGPPCGGPFAESVCWCCGYAVDCCNCGTSRASSRSLYERRRLTRWLLDRVRVVGSRKPFLCVGGKEKWFAHLSCGRGGPGALDIVKRRHARASSSSTGTGAFGPRCWPSGAVIIIASAACLIRIRKSYETLPER